MDTVIARLQREQWVAFGRLKSWRDLIEGTKQRIEEAEKEMADVAVAIGKLGGSTGMKDYQEAHEAYERRLATQHDSSLSETMAPGRPSSLGFIRGGDLQN